MRSTAPRAPRISLRAELAYEQFARGGRQCKVECVMGLNTRRRAASSRGRAQSVLLPAAWHGSRA
eukprot:9671476-Heterocapsa_arctica.AAC.1